jgi:hypothetical protein
MSKLRQLIRESITEYIREIDEAGNMAALEAKMSKTQEAIDKRKKMAAMEGIDEAYHEMLDKGKMKEITSEIKVLEKSLTKYEKMLEKLKSKADKTPKVEEEKEIVDEVAVDLDENEEMEYEGMEYEKEEERFDADGTPNEEGMYDAEGNRVSFADIDKVDYEMNMNESFLHMQKLAGVITEAQYKAKRKALNEEITIGGTYTASMPISSRRDAERIDIKVKVLGKDRNDDDEFIVTPLEDKDYTNPESNLLNRFEKGKQYGVKTEFIK